MDPLVLVMIAVGALVLVAVAMASLRRRRPRLAPPRPTAGPLGWGARLRAALDRDRVDWQQVEETLVAGDVGVELAGDAVSAARELHRRTGGDPRHALAETLVGMFGERDRSLRLESSPSVVVVVGVNGSGKTTTIAKLAAMLEARGSSAILAAADTFRAAAVEQLRRWGDRLGVDVVGGAEGGDPAAVAFDALSAARARGKDVLIVDTAGRLHSKSNLMDELAKVVRVLEREAGAIDEVLLVVDAGTGQNVLAQARTFTAAVGVTGVVLAKLDGTARGGMALAVEQGLGIPVKLAGVGEKPDDLLHFDPRWLVERLMEET